MPLDAVFLTGLTAELSERITGMKIDKVQQPEKDVVVLTLRGAGGSCRLLLCAGVGSARVCESAASYENPAQPPMFCMLLRKHLTGARIVSVSQPDMERMIIIELDCRDELGVQARKRLVVEMMGRATNIILVGAEGNIIDCLRRVDADMSARRPLQPGGLYRLPPRQDRPQLFELTAQQRLAFFPPPADAQLDKWLQDSFAGLSPVICRELCCRCYGQTSPRVSELSAEQLMNLTDMLDAFAATVERREFVPTMVLEGGVPREFSFMPLMQYTGLESRCFDSFSELLEAFYSVRDRRESMRRRASGLTKTVRSARDRAARRLAQRREELLRAANREEYRRCGDLITSNMYRLKKGDRVLEAEDWYADGTPTVRVQLDPLKTPSQNAAKYYKDYNRAKNAEMHLTELIATGSKELEYLESVLDMISRAESESDLVQLRRELSEGGYIRNRQTGKKERIKPRAPLKFISTNGFEILVGRSNSENDTLTFKTARRSDLWLHAQKIHGSHVVVSCLGLEPDEDTVSEAASLAAYYSQSRDGGKIPVDMTLIRNVKKPAGALPGMVVYTDQRTIMAAGDPALAERLAAK